MIRSLAAGFCVLASVGLTGTAQPPAGHPTQPPARPPGQGPAEPVDHHPEAQIPSAPAANAEWPKAKPEDVGSIDAILGAFYSVTSGPSKQAREWDRFRSLFYPDARLIAARDGGDGSAGAVYVPVIDYVEQNRKYIEKGGFVDREVARRVEQFGNAVHVWSTFETRRGKDGSQPYSRGINSIQLLKDGGRYWIITVYWDHERADNPIPEKYLQTPKE